MKKNFVRVMLFGALTLAVTTTVTSCKDYDDDIKGLQEQVDNIKSTNPVSTEDMKAAVDAATKALEKKVKDLQDLVDGKVTATDLEAKIKELAMSGYWRFFTDIYVWFISFFTHKPL